MEDYGNRAVKSFTEAIQSPYRAAANIAEIVQQRNADFYLTLVENTREMLRDPSPQTYDRAVQSLSNERIKQRDAIGAAATEAMDAYLDVLYAPFYYLRGR